MSDERIEVAGVSISHPDRLVYPEAGLSKLDVARYHADVADRMLRTLADRPVSLVRLPEGLGGERFFQKHPGRGFPAAIRHLRIAEADGDTADYMYLADAAGLVGATQMGALEFHVWGARHDDLERPDRLVLDLDPDAGLPFAEVVAAACDLRDRLADLGLGSYPLVTGGKGVHVVAPLRRIAGWHRVAGFAQTFARGLARDEPRRFVAEMSKSRREGRIFVDWLRNQRGATAVAPWSLRARPRAPVALPVAWDELAGLPSAACFGIDEARERDWSDLDLPRLAGLTEARVARLHRHGPAAAG